MNWFNKLRNYNLKKLSYKQFYELESQMTRFMKNYALYFGRDKIKKITSLIPPGNDLILDIGCGTGYITRRLRLKGHNVFGLDISENRIKEAGINCLVGSATNTPFKNEKFDYIIASDVLEHLPGDLKKNLLGVSELIKNDGQLIISVPYGWANNDKGHIHKLNINEWESLFKEQGLKIIKKVSANYSLLKLNTPFRMNYIYLLSKNT